MFLDIIKVFVFRAWNFELTAKLFPTPARRAKLAARQVEQARQDRVNALWLRLKKGTDKFLADPVLKQKIIDTPMSA